KAIAATATTTGARIRPRLGVTGGRVAASSVRVLSLDRVGGLGVAVRRVSSGTVAPAIPGAPAIADSGSAAATGAVFFGRRGRAAGGRAAGPHAARAARARGDTTV